jgi:hypothetical protein
MSLPSAQRRVFGPRPAITAGLALVVVSSAWALGAWAIAYLVVRRARVGQLSVGELEIGQLTVGRLDIREDSRTEPGKAATRPA